MPLREGKYRYYVGGKGGSRTAPTEREEGWMVGGWRCGQDWGMDSRLRLHGGRLCAGTTERGMGMTERVSTRRGKFQTCPYVKGSIGIMWGGRAVREPPLRRGREDGWWTDGVAGGGRDGFPPPSSRGQALRGNNGKGGVAGRIGGWVPAFVFTGEALRGNNGWGCGNEGRG